MYAQGGIRIELHRGNKHSVFDVHSDRALIGSGAHCDVRLAPDEAAIEHLVVQLVGDDEVIAESKAMDPVCLLNGAPFLEGRLLPTSMLELGGVALRVVRTEKEEKNAVRSKGNSNSATSPTVQVLGVLGVLVGLYVVLSKPSTIDSGIADEVEPPLLAATVAEPCSERDPHAAAAMAEQAEREAENQRERSPFFASAATEAVALFEQASGCYQSGGETARATETHAAASRLIADMRDQIHVRHVRLSRYLTQHNWADARQQALLLSELVVEKNGPYARWLSSVRREGEIRASTERRR